RLGNSIGSFMTSASQPSRRFLTAWPLAAMLLVMCPMASLAQPGRDQLPDLPVYDSKYYLVYTDLEGDEVRETIIRMTKMAEEYHARTRDFSGAIRQRMPFILYKDAAKYYATGAPMGTAGYFDGRKLVAITGKQLSQRTW